MVSSLLQFAVFYHITGKNGTLFFLVVAEAGKTCYTAFVYL